MGRVSSKCSRREEAVTGTSYNRKEKEESSGRETEINGKAETKSKSASQTGEEKG